MLCITYIIRCIQTWLCRTQSCIDQRCLLTVVELERPQFVLDERRIWNIKSTVEDETIHFVSLFHIIWRRNLAGSILVKFSLLMEAQIIFMWYPGKGMWYLCTVSLYSLYNNLVQYYEHDIILISNITTIILFSIHIISVFLAILSTFFALLSFLHSSLRCVQAEDILLFRFASRYMRVPWDQSAKASQLQTHPFDGTII